MKKLYVKPIIELIEIEIEDVIACSITDCDRPGNGNHNGHHKPKYRTNFPYENFDISE